MLDNQTIGNNILFLRKQLNLTQVELSKLLGISHQAVSKWENGDCLPDIEILLKLAKVFNTSVEELLLIEHCLNGSEPSKSSELDEDTERYQIGTNVNWESMLEEIKKKISWPSYRTWFKDTTAKYDGEIFVVYSPNQFSSEWLYRRYSSLILKMLEELTGDDDMKVEFRSKACNGSITLSDRASLHFQNS